MGKLARVIAVAAALAVVAPSAAAAQVPSVGDPVFCVFVLPYAHGAGTFDMSGVATCAGLIDRTPFTPALNNVFLSSDGLSTGDPCVLGQWRDSDAFLADQSSGQGTTFGLQIDWAGGTGVITITGSRWVGGGVAWLNNSSGPCSSSVSGMFKMTRRPSGS